ncbi:MAG: primase [Pseudomonadota bacterium]
MAIPQSFIQELLSRVDVVEVVGRYVQLKKGGANFMGLCPFHGEKSPSFTVSPTKQFFHCFGCGKNGNAIGFLMDHAGMTFIEAVKDLAQQTGMTVPEDDLSPQDRAKAAEQKQKQSSLTDMLEKAGEAYRQHLKNAPKAVAYLKGRGLSGQIAKRFGLGYAPEGWRSLASVFPDYDNPLLSESGLVIVNEDDDKRYDRFRDRVMFPIRNIKGECIGFGGRVMGDGTPKYLNSPETPVFHKGRELYGLFEARDSIHSAGYVLVTEGYMDVVALAQWGFPNAVATLGTACTPDHVQKLFRFTDSVVFSFDGDNAGRRAARKALDGALSYATDVRSIKFLFLPQEHDPDSFIRAQGSEAFSNCVAHATPLSKFLIEVASEACDLQSAEGRAHLSSNASPLWRALPDGALKRQLLTELAHLIQLDPGELAGLWLQQAEAAAARGQPRGPSPNNSAAAQGTNRNALQAEGIASETSFDPEGLPSPFEQTRSVPYQKSGTRARPDGKSWQKDANGKWRLVGGNDNPSSLGPRTAPASRADHAVRLVLSNMALWDTLSAEDHALVCDLPGQHGELMRWLESQFHDHGPLAWGTLQTELQNQSFAPLANKLMGSHLPVEPGGSAEGEPGEAHKELRLLLNLMLMDQLKALETAALKDAESTQDPAAFQRWRELHQRRRSLIDAQVL